MLFFMDKSTNKCVLTKKLGGQVYNYNMAICQHNPKILFEWYNQYNGSSLLLLRKTTSWTMKDEYLMSLIHLEDDFDDDLLQDAMNLLGFE